MSVEARCAELRAAGEALAARPAREIVAALAEACDRWADPEDPDRQAAERALAEHLGVPREPVRRILDAAFPGWGRMALTAWLEGELGDVEALDRFLPLGGGRRRAVGARLTVFLEARGIPTTPIADLLSALCVKSAVWVKPAVGADDLAARFARTLGVVDPGFAAAVETEGWTPGSPEAAAVLGAADVVVATGGEETMAALRRITPPDARLLLHGPRLSAAVLCHEALEADPAGAIAALAEDTAFAGQAGCLCPVVAWVEAPPDAVEEMAEAVAAACAERWPGPARVESAATERAAWAEWTAVAEVESVIEGGGRRAGGLDAPWTVLTQARARPPEPPPVPRALVLAPVESADGVAALCAARRGWVASVGVAGPTERLEGLAPALAAAGVERICPLGRMQLPPADWRRDGRPTLADLVRWVDLET